MAAMMAAFVVAAKLTIQRLINVYSPKNSPLPGTPDTVSVATVTTGRFWNDMKPLGTEEQQGEPRSRFAKTASRAMRAESAISDTVTVFDKYANDRFESVNGSSLLEM